MEDVKQNIVAYLNSHRKMTLATSSSDAEPAAATVDYVSDEDGAVIYFGTNKNTAKVSNINQNPMVAYAVDEDYDNWKDIQGVQIQGQASIVTDQNEAQKVAQMFGQKFPQMSDMPISEDSVFVKVEPRIGYFIDYTKGFANRDQISF